MYWFQRVPVVSTSLFAFHTLKASGCKSLSGERKEKQCCPGGGPTHPGCFLNAFDLHHHAAPPPRSTVTSGGSSAGEASLFDKTGGSDCCSVLMQCGAVCLHVFSIWNSWCANTAQPGPGGTQQIFLVTPATPLKTTTTHSCSAVSAHSTETAMWHFDFRQNMTLAAQPSTWLTPKKHVKT